MDALTCCGGLVNHIIGCEADPSRGGVMVKHHPIGKPPLCAIDREPWPCDAVKPFQLQDLQETQHTHSTCEECGWCKVCGPCTHRKVETINHPEHYGGDTIYEAIKVIEAWGLGFCLGNAVKYISRAGKKDPTKTIEDLKKARWYLDREISRLEGEQ